ncbi:hypothetical protein SERLA73DRAFT_178076 [Serpula lacrymans var. lacrymans S7.3]|uniref:Uncharacterized protein n=2 Tax=Serpula lacrymans var. lacrymans TaxID=341189 RepID=F8PQI3_SERL3|nr:uncharacterized protein SERLADRAFT_462265 [Serpula lacrymans var. lacrymans S7.9]EGO02231.1 hypothetical protein SERLA73DRAFT_178076 [Serpula lacrymans var. lacrymans S7.3]EGO27948.1 hypothetical protein SERLADRAFT_462265 [Serpula lacrymans var. lacrymans S7.9]
MDALHWCELERRPNSIQPTPTDAGTSHIGDLGGSNTAAYPWNVGSAHVQHPVGS